MPFKEVLQLLLCKSVKSLQIKLRDWFGTLASTVTASAFCQARNKFRHTAFIELLEKCVVDVMYGDSSYQRYKGHRLLALDGSSLRLPSTSETRQHFGVIEFSSGTQKQAGTQVEAKMTVLYDVLNKIPISATIDKGRRNDIHASKGHLNQLVPGDIILADRGYESLEFFQEILGKKAHFVIRCKQKSYNKYHGLWSHQELNDVTVDMEMPAYVTSKSSNSSSVRIRFVRISLPDGEVEVLATSLLDTALFTYRSFKQLYYKRWKIETYFHTLKSRLCLDNFTGRNVESIYQDFHSTIFISGFETIISAGANDELKSRNTKHPLQVNKAISFHAIKDRVVKLLFEQPPDCQEQITELILASPTSVRKDRIPPPRTRGDTWGNRRSLYFQRYVRKHVF